MRRGLRGNSRFWRSIAVIALVRSDIVRHSALRDGVYGKSRFWRSVAVMLFANDARRALTVKEPDRLGTERLVEGQGVTVLALTRPSRRAQRRSARAS